MSAEKAGGIYSWFYFSIYALALLGGILADATKKYKLVILAGIIIMFAGYVVMAVPGMSLTITIAGLFTIALGNGLFKGNLRFGNGLDCRLYMCGTRSLLCLFNRLCEWSKLLRVPEVFHAGVANRRDQGIA